MNFCCMEKWFQEQDGLGVSVRGLIPDLLCAPEQVLAFSGIQCVCAERFVASEGPAVLIILEPSVYHKGH